MKVLVDENIPRMTVNRLRELGHDVKDIRGTADQGLGDPGLWSVAMAEGRLLIRNCSLSCGSRSILSVLRNNFRR